MSKVAARMLVSAYRSSERQEELRARLDVVTDIIDLYLKLNYPAAYDEVQRARANASVEERDANSELIAENMGELYEQLMQMDDVL